MLRNFVRIHALTDQWNPSNLQTVFLFVYSNCYYCCQSNYKVFGLAINPCAFKGLDCDIF